MMTNLQPLANSEVCLFTFIYSFGFIIIMIASALEFYLSQIL